MRPGLSRNARTFTRPKKLINPIKPDFSSLADEIAEPRPDMNFKVAAFTVSEKSINIKAYHVHIMYSSSVGL